MIAWLILVWNCFMVMHRAFTEKINVLVEFSSCNNFLTVVFSFYRTIDSGLFPSEVITYDQWMQLKPGHSSFSGWMKGAFRGKKELQEEPLDQKLKAILGTAPMWDK